MYILYMYLDKGPICVVDPVRYVRNEDIIE